MGRLGTALAMANKLARDVKVELDRATDERQQLHQQPPSEPSYCSASQGESRPGSQWAQGRHTAPASVILPPSTGLRRSAGGEPPGSSSAGYTPLTQDMPPQSAAKEDLEREAAEARAAFARITLDDDEERARQGAERQMDEDRKMAERLEAEYKAEYKQESLERSEKVDRSMEAKGPPPLPPRQTSGRSSTRAGIPTTSAIRDNAATYSHSQQSRPGGTAPLLPAPQPSHRSGRPSPAQHVSGIVPVTECVDQPVDIPLLWAIHPEASYFTICTKCYVDYIHESPFRDLLTIQKLSDGTACRCLFGTSRMQKEIWPEAVWQRDFSTALEYMKRRQKLQHCPLQTPVRERSWYETSECPGLAFCEACYEDEMVGTSFAKHFKLENHATTAFCDMAVPCIKNAYQRYSTENQWPNFVADAAARMQMTPCPKAEVVDGSKYVWFDAQDISVCLACYCDYFVETESTNRFRQAGGKHGQMRCALGDMNILLMVQEASSRKDLEMFWSGLSDMACTPWCNPAGTKGATWYRLVDGAPEFAVCGRCAVGIFRSLRVDHFLVRQPLRAVHEPHLCAMNLAHPRIAGHLSALMAAALQGNPKPLADFSTMFTAVPPCPRLNFEASKGKKWWGWDHATICEECYLTFAKGLGLDSQFEYVAEFKPGSMMCDVYSPRMRNLYREACQTNDLHGFLEAAKHRRQMFIEAYLPAKNLEDQMWIAVEESKNAGIMGTAYKSMGGAQDVVMGHNYTLGNAQVGYGHVNELAFQGALYDLQSRQAAAQATDIATAQRIRELKMRWAMVE